MSQKYAYRPTSRAAHESVKPRKPSHFEKIIEGLNKIKVGGTFEEISRSCGLSDSQVWKRLSELERGGVIFNTYITRKLKSGDKGIVWQLTGLPISENMPVTKSDKKEKKQPPIVFNPLFGE